MTHSLGWGDSPRDSDPTHIIPGDTCNCQDTERHLANDTPEGRGPQPSPEAVPSGLRAGGFRALSQVFPLSPAELAPESGGGGVGVPLHAGSPSPEAPPMRPGARLAGQPCSSAFPQGCVECPRGQVPSRWATPGGRRERRARGTRRQPPGLGDLPRAARGASRAPARASRRARAGGAGGGRAAMVAGLRCSSSRGRAAGAHHPTRAPSRGRASPPEGFRLQGVGSGPLAQRPRRRRAS